VRNPSFPKQEFSRCGILRPPSRRHGRGRRGQGMLRCPAKPGAFYVDGAAELLAGGDVPQTDCCSRPCRRGHRPRRPGAATPLGGRPPCRRRRKGRSFPSDLQKRMFPSSPRRRDFPSGAKRWPRRRPRSSIALPLSPWGPTPPRGRAGPGCRLMPGLCLPGKRRDRVPPPGNEPPPARAASSPGPTSQRRSFFVCCVPRRRRSPWSGRLGAKSTAATGRLPPIGARHGRRLRRPEQPPCRRPRRWPRDLPSWE